MVKRVLTGLMVAGLLASVARAQDYTASDRIKTPQEAAQRLCKSGAWLVINKYERADPATDNKSSIVFEVFRHLDRDETPQVWDETLVVDASHEFYGRWVDLFVGNELHFQCAENSKPAGFYTKGGISYPEILDKSYFLAPVRRKYER